MSFDSIAIAAVSDELRATVVDGRVQKIVQADENTFGLELYSGHERRWLLLDASPQSPRAHLSQDKVGRAEMTTPLLLLMRKHLRGARLVAVEQPDFERTLHLVFATFGGTTGDDGERQIISLDDAPRVRLIIEAIGRYSNVALVDGRGQVLECAKRVTSEINRYRVVLPRHAYVPPPPQEKSPLAALSIEDLAARIAAAPPKTAAQQLLVGAYAGLSPQLAREAVFRATGRATTTAGEVDSTVATEAIVAELSGILRARETGEWSPSVARRDGAVFAFAPYRLTQHEGAAGAEVFDVASVSAAIESFYAQRERFRPVDQAREVARRPLAAKLAAAAKKRDSLELALASGQRAEEMRLRGETILAHIHEMTRGLRSLNRDGVEVELNPGLSASENAQAYFKRYRKAKAALAGVPALLEDTRLYLAYLGEAAAHLDLAETPEQVRAVQREFNIRDVRASGRGGVPPAKRAAPKGATRGGRRSRDVGPSLAGLTRYVASDGAEILVGRSGRLNDWVTFDLAGPDDVWLHARGVPGAHVILRAFGATPSDATLAAAAQLAAWYSASRDATTVPVDFTRRRQVRRIREALPGLVNYTGERTIAARPEVPASVQRIG